MSLDFNKLNVSDLYNLEEEMKQTYLYFNKTYFWQGLDVRLRHNEEYKPEQIDKLKFEWKLIQWQSSKATSINLHLDLVFEHPEYISMYQGGDYLQVTFHNLTLFNDTKGLYVEQDIMIDFKIPTQLKNGAGTVLI